MIQKTEDYFGEPVVVQGASDYFASPAAPPAKPPVSREPVVPEWGRENPNLYGLAGTIFENFQPIIHGLGAAGGAALGTGASPALGPAGPVLGGAGGYAVAKNLTDALASLLGHRGSESASIATDMATELKELPKELATGANMEMGGQIAGAAAPYAVKGIEAGARGIGKAAQALIGATTGVGSGAVKQALKGGDAFTNALRGKVSEEQIAKTFQDAVKMLVQRRGAAYQAQLGKIGRITDPIDITPLRNELTNQLYAFNVRATKGGTLDFTRSAINKSAQKDVDEIVEIIRGWGTKKNDNTPIMLDTLKRRLDDFYSDSSQVRAMVTGLKKTVRGLIEKKVPEYATMTKDYAQATSLIQDIEKVFTGKRGEFGFSQIASDKALRRLTQSMKESYGLRQEMIQILGEKTGQDLMGEVAGYTMSEAVPRGLLGRLFGMGGLYVAAMNPKYWPVLAASSPRVVGEFLNVYGRGLKEAQVLKPAMEPAFRAAGMTGTYKNLFPIKEESNE